MKRIVYSSLALTLMLVLLQGCREKPWNGNDDPVIPRETLITNKWIKDNMTDVYYWNDKMPKIDYTLEPDPEVYFKKLLYKDEDKWSRITRDYPSLKADLEGKPLTMGYEPAFFLISDNKIVIVVKYVYPGSAAADGGLKRGDIILSIDNTQMDKSNYYDLYSGDSYTVQLGRLEGNSLVPTGESKSLRARVTTTDPLIHHSVIDVDGHKIAYMVYVEFIAGEGSKFLLEMDNILNSFKAEGVTDLVVDLRYNPGGEISAAVHLASEIAPWEVISGGSTLITLKYNKELEAFLRGDMQKYGSYLAHKFKTTSANLDLDRVFFLTTSGTASASELVITGLDPYMDVVKIGEATYGKYAGAWVIPDDNEKWAILPIVSKYSNNDGYTDFVNGLPPDYEIEDDLFEAVQFGDTDDPMLARAIELATGKKYAPKRVRKGDIPKYPEIMPERMKLRSSLILQGCEINQYVD